MAANQRLVSFKGLIGQLVIREDGYWTVVGRNKVLVTSNSGILLDSSDQDFEPGDCLGLSGSQRRRDSEVELDRRYHRLVEEPHQGRIGLFWWVHGGGSESWTVSVQGVFTEFESRKLTAVLFE